MTPFNLYENFYANADQSSVTRKMVGTMYKHFISFNRTPFTIFLRWHSTLAQILNYRTPKTNGGESIGICLYNYDKKVTAAQIPFTWQRVRSSWIHYKHFTSVRNCQYSNYVVPCAIYEIRIFPSLSNENKMCPKCDILKKLMVPMFPAILNLYGMWENVSFHSSLLNPFFVCIHNEWGQWQM